MHVMWLEWKNTFISLSLLHTQTHKPSRVLCAVIYQIPICQTPGRRAFVRLPFHPVAADSPRSDNARWQVDGIINNDFHPFQLSGRAASHNRLRRQGKHGHMLTHRDSDLWPFYLLCMQVCGQRPTQAHRLTLTNTKRVQTKLRWKL